VPTSAPRPPARGRGLGRQRIVGRISDQVFVLLVEAGLVVAAVLFLLGL
jgi:hypothetical protein